MAQSLPCFLCASICPVSDARVIDTCPTVTCFDLSLLTFMFLQGTKPGQRANAFTHWSISPSQNWIVYPAATGNANCPFSLLHGFWWDTLITIILFYITFCFFFKVIHKVLKTLTNSTIDLLNDSGDILFLSLVALQLIIASKTWTLNIILSVIQIQ